MKRNHEIESLALTANVVCRHVNISRSPLRVMIKEGNFPVASIVVRRRRKHWIILPVDQWINNLSKPTSSGRHRLQG